MSADPFLTHRSLLFTVAYEMLGSAADAEDVVQETWLRWEGLDRAEIAAPRAYLVRMVTRQALNRMRTVARRREDYFGEWLPEPLLTAPEVAEDAEFAESISLAMLTVLETLGPTERAVFVLREVFGTPYEEIAQAVGKSATAVRQVAHRARRHVAERRPRMRVDSDEQMAVAEKLMAALSAGDVRELMEVLAPEVVAIADGGGIVPALGRPLAGADKLAAQLLRLSQITSYTADIAWINGAPGIRFRFEGGSAAISLAVEAGRITRVYAVNNPQKLGRFDEVVELRR